MESLAAHDGYYTLGGANAGRMPAARHRLQVDGFYIPLAESTQLGMLDLQRDERLPRIYSQSAGLADFLMHDGDGAIESRWSSISWPSTPARPIPRHWPN